MNKQSARSTTIFQDRMDDGSIKESAASLEGITWIRGRAAPLADEFENIATFLAVRDLCGHEELVPVVFISDFALALELKAIPKNWVASDDTRQRGNAGWSHERSFVGTPLVLRKNLLKSVIHGHS